MLDIRFLNLQNEGRTESCYVEGCQDTKRNYHFLYVHVYTLEIVKAIFCIKKNKKTNRLAFPLQRTGTLNKDLHVFTVYAVKELICTRGLPPPPPLKVSLANPELSIKT